METIDVDPADYQRRRPRGQTVKELMDAMRDLQSGQIRGVLANDPKDIVRFRNSMLVAARLLGWQTPKSRGFGTATQERDGKLYLLIIRD